MAIQKKLYTVTEFEDLIDHPENRDRRFELIDGEIVEKVPTELHSLIAGNIYTFLRLFILPRNLGRIVFEVRFRLKGDNHNSRLPDVSFTRAERVQPVVEKGAVTQIPDLCVEIQSPSDSPKSLRDRAAYYLANGAQMVWLVYPKKRMIEALYPDGEFDIFNAEDTLTGGDLLPGFAVEVKAIFEV